MSSFNTRITSLKTKASVGTRAADVLKECERMEKQNMFLKTLLREANDTEMFNHVLDSHLGAIAKLIPEFKTGPFFKKPAKTTLVNPITDKITILRDFIRHSTTSGMGIDYKFPEKRQVEIERQSQEQAQQAMQDRAFVRRLEDIARARAQTVAGPPPPFGATTSASHTAQFPTFGAHQSGAHQSGAPSFPVFSVPSGSQSAQVVPPAFGFGFPAGYAPPTYTSMDRNTTSQTEPAHPSIKKPRFATAPKRTNSAQKQATNMVTQQLGASTTATTTQIPPSQ